ncbi:cytochrome P450 [Abortiporus biennis]|nr:cytochrome P450 [Abortiporus biennis]
MVFLQAVFLLGVTWLGWKLLNGYFVKSPLDNIPGPARASLFIGNLGQFFSRHGWDFLERLGNQYGGVVKLHGILGGRYLYVFDPAAMHSIVIKDHANFEETSWYLASNNLLFGPGLLAVHGDIHRRQRKLLSPVFSINHLRRMTPIFYNITHKLRDAIHAQVKSGPKELDILNWMGRGTLEILGQAGLGYSFDPIVEDVSNTFGDAVKAFLPTLFSIHLHRMFIPFVGNLGPANFRRKVLDMYPNKSVQKMKDLVDTLYAQALQIVGSKKDALAKGDEAVKQQVGEGKDIMSTLLKANMEASADESLSDEMLIAIVNTLVFAATDTTSQALTRTLCLLAENPDIQQKLREEVTAAMGETDLPYDEIMELPFLDAICRETLRLHPPVTTVFRDTQKDTVLPVWKPFTGVDGQTVTEIPVPKGTPIIISMIGFNRNKAVWGEDADEWRPERWLKDLPDTVRDSPSPGVYSNLLTFLGGGRSCIGFKFSQLEMKIILAMIISSFKFSLPKRKIVWNIANITYPTVDNEDKASLPLTVELVQPNLA